MPPNLTDHVQDPSTIISPRWVSPLICVSISIILRPSFYCQWEEVTLRVTFCNLRLQLYLCSTLAGVGPSAVLEMKSMEREL